MYVTEYLEKYNRQITKWHFFALLNDKCNYFSYRNFIFAFRKAEQPRDSLSDRLKQYNKMAYKMWALILNHEINL